MADAPAPTTPAPDAAPTAAARSRGERRVTVPGGSARLVAEISVRPDARPDEEITLQALETGEGEALVRLGYRREGRMLRGPVTATPAELAALVAAARREPALEAALPAAPDGRTT
jgi:hypothetical protein